jgi:hypothetical protein
MLADLMEKDHELLDHLLQRLECALRRRDVVRSFALLDRFWARLAIHIRAENVCLFPAILNAHPKIAGGIVPSLAEVERVIEQLRVDHNFFMDQLSGAVKTMRQFLSSSDTYTQWKRTREVNSIRARLREVASRLKAHNQLEEEHVYKWPALMLNAADSEKVYEVLRREIENLPPRFLPESSADPRASVGA